VIGPYFFEGRQSSNSKFIPLQSDAWCWNPDSLVSARRDNGLMRELQFESSSRFSQLAWSLEEGKLHDLQDRPISTTATSSSGDISRAKCTKRNQGKRWTWNRTSETKWQQFHPACWNMINWRRTSSNACGNVLTTRDGTSQAIYSGSEYCN
jgi:hypothetical protein